MFNTLMNVLRGYRRSFSTLETAILGEVRLALPPRVRTAFDDRLHRINVVQPILGGQEINLYERRKGEILFSASSRMLTTNSVKCIARVTLQSSDILSRLRVGLYCGNGVLTSMEFDQPSEHATLASITGMQVSISQQVPWCT